MKPRRPQGVDTQTTGKYVAACMFGFGCNSAAVARVPVSAYVESGTQEERCQRSDMELLTRRTIYP